MSRRRRRTLAPGVVAGPLSGAPSEIVRIVVDGPRGEESRVEVTCLDVELGVILPWLVEHRGSLRDHALPLPEHSQRPWTTGYRWTAGAWNAYREHIMNAA